MIATSQIVFRLSEEETTVVRLNAEIMLVGRRPDSTIQIEEPSVSGRHAELIPLPDGTCRCRDLGSTNGTKVNGQPILDETLLQNGDRIEFGAVTGTFQTDEENIYETAFFQPLPEAVIQARTAVGAVLEDRYRLEEALSGAGGYTVFRATDTTRDEPVSLRVLTPAFVHAREGFRRLEDHVNRLRINPHPNLVTLHELRTWADRALLVTEWIEGVPLLDVLRRRQALRMPEALSLLRPAAAAADHADTHGLSPLDFNLRPTLLAFTEGSLSPPGQGQKLLDVPLVDWPTFQIKFGPRVDESESSQLTALASGTPSSVPELAALACELLGHPLPGIRLGPGGISRAKPKMIATLGEIGNQVLLRGLTGTEPPFSTHAAFVEALAASQPTSF